MKILSILSVICALVSLLGFAVQFFMTVFSDVAWERWETFMNIAWFLSDGGAGFAILLLGIGVAVQSFKKRNNTITP